MLTIEDFISDYQHFVVRDEKDKINEHIETHFNHIKDECYNFLKNKNNISEVM